MSKVKAANKEENGVTSAAAWRKESVEGIPVTLPSGKTPRLRAVALDTALANGKIPDFLSGIAAQALWGGVTTESFAEAVDASKNYTELVNLVLEMAFVYPRINPDETAVLDEDEIYLTDVDTEDKLTVFSLVTTGVNALRKFRIIQKPDVVSVPNGKDDGDATK